MPRNLPGLICATINTGYQIKASTAPYDDEPL